MVVNLWFWHCDSNESTCQIIEKVWWFYLILSKFLDAFSIQINAWLADIQNRSQKSCCNSKLARRPQLKWLIRGLNLANHPLARRAGHKVSSHPLCNQTRSGSASHHNLQIAAVSPRAAVSAVSRVIVSMAASIIGPGLITSLWPWYWRLEDKRRIFNLLFICFLARFHNNNKCTFDIISVI